MESIPEAGRRSVDGSGVCGKISNTLLRPALGGFLFIQKILLVFSTFPEYQSKKINCNNPVFRGIFIVLK